MGFLEVAKNLRTILGNIKFCKRDIADYQPDVLVLVDYPGFNLRIAEFAKSLGIKVVYYISPQLWAWKEGRVEKIKNFVDEMLVILPFEKEFYKKHHVDAHFVGHPLLDAISDLPKISAEDFKKEHGLNEKEIIALLPGSREQEVEKMLALMLSVRAFFKNYQFVIAGAPSLTKEFYSKFVDDDVHFVSNKTYDLLRCSSAALVTSGTATLETALLNTPQVVCYAANSLNIRIAKAFVKVKYISLVNLIPDMPIVQELIQEDLSVSNLTREILKLEDDADYRNKMLEAYGLLKTLVGEPGVANRMALDILHRIG